MQWWNPFGARCRRYYLTANNWCLGNHMDDLAPVLAFLDAHMFGASWGRRLGMMVHYISCVGTYIE